MVTWLPYYLVHDRHLSVDSMAKIAAVYYLVDATSAIATGWFSDFWIRRGFTPTLVRKSAMAIGHTTAAIALAGCVLAGPHTYLPWLLIVGAGSGIGGSGIYSFCQILAGPKAAGEMDRVSKRLRKSRGRRLTGAHRIHRESHWEFPIGTCHHRRGSAGRRFRMGLWGRPSHAGDLVWGWSRSPRCCRHAT